jgi:hypothetical protein
VTSETIVQVALFAATVTMTGVTYYFAYVKQPTGLDERPRRRRQNAQIWIYYAAGLALVQLARLIATLQGS